MRQQPRTLCRSICCLARYTRMLGGAIACPTIESALTRLRTRRYVVAGHTTKPNFVVSGAMEQSAGLLNMSSSSAAACAHGTWWVLRPTLPIVKRWRLRCAQAKSAFVQYLNKWQSVSLTLAWMVAG